MDADQLAGAMIEQLAQLFERRTEAKKWARRDYARRAPLVTRREGTSPVSRHDGEKGITPSNDRAYEQFAANGG